jgi:hypothetical protein
MRSLDVHVQLFMSKKARVLYTECLASATSRGCLRGKIEGPDEHSLVHSRERECLTSENGARVNFVGANRAADSSLKEDRANSAECLVPIMLQFLKFNRCESSNTHQ